MSDSRVKCLFCGQVFMVDKEKAGASAPCPACGKETFLDMPDDPGRLESYQIKDSSGVTEDSRDCPACGAPVPGNALVCTQCGYNLETGQKKNTRIVRQGTALSRFAVPVLLMIISGMAVYIVQESRFEQRLEKARAQWEASTARVSAAPLPAMSAPPAAAAAEEPAAAAAEAPVPVAPPAEAVVQSPEEEAGVLAQREQRFRDELDKQSPLFPKNESVTLVGKTGRVHRGRLIGLKSDVVVLAVAGGTEEIALNQLSHESRLRCDKTYRDEYIKRRVQPRR